MSAKLHMVHGAPATYAFRCPGCKCAHTIPVAGDNPQQVWGWNGSVEAPTFTPSINYTDPDHHCHSFVMAGRIQFLGDCDHALAGQTVELPDWSKSG